MKPKAKIFFVLNILIIVITGIIIIWQLFFAEEQNDKLLVRAIVLFAVYFLAVTGIRKKRSINTVVYEEQYKDFLGNAFNSDRFSYRRLMKAIVLYNENKPDKAIAVLDSVRKNCLYSDDFSAVLFFKALCLEEQQNFAEAAECYTEVLEHNRNHATAWSNLGLVYQNLGRSTDSLNAYIKALECDPNNAYACNNIASHYVKNGEAEKGLEYALRAVELNSKLYQAMGAAAMAYKMLGDDENAEKYRRMYGANGGDGKNLKNVLENI